MIERSRVRIPEGVAGEFSSPGSTFCAGSYFAIGVLPPCYRSSGSCVVVDPGHFVKREGSRLQLNTHAPYVCDFA